MTAQQILESLTPGGHWYKDKPERCAEYIRLQLKILSEQRDNHFKCLKLMEAHVNWGAPPPLLTEKHLGEVRSILDGFVSVVYETEDDIVEHSYSLSQFTTLPEEGDLVTAHVSLRRTG